MLEVTGSTALVGIYSAAVDFTGQTVSLLIGTASLAGQPLAFRARDHGTNDDLMTQLRANASIIFVIGLGATIGLISLAGPIAHVYFGPRFQAYSGSLIPFVLTLSALGVLLSGFRGFYFEQAFEIAYETWPLAVIMAARTTTTVAIGYFAVRAYGIVGAAVTVLVTEVWSFGFSLVWGRRFVTMPIPVLNFAKAGFAAAVMSVVLFLMPNRDTIVGLSASVLVGVLVYGVILALCFDRELAVIQAFLRRIRDLRGRLTRP
jgi:O-antigen/teichoic acid export membrane protein